MTSIDLSQLVSPMTTQDFLKNHWPHKHLFIPPQIDKLKKILNLDQLQTVENLMGSRSLKVRACLPDFDDEYSSVLLDPADALKAFKNSMTLVFDGMQKQNTIIADSLDQIRSDLGLFTGVNNDFCQARSIAYATPAGQGTRLHFDANANFIIQIKGSKQWRLAENKSVLFPTERFTTGSEEMPFALESQCHDMLIDQLDENAIEIDMQPGCVLFVPRGYWHETSTFEDSLSLNFTFSQPTYADVLTKGIKEILLQSSDWRALFQGINHLDQTQLEERLMQFKIQTQKMTVDQILEAARL